MRVLVCGGREYTSQSELYHALDLLASEVDIEEIIHGDCRGADRLAGSWAQERGVPWSAHPILPGESGFDRNARMLRSTHPDLVVYFPGGNGTKHMVRIAREAEVDTHGGHAGSTIRQRRLI